MNCSSLDAITFGGKFSASQVTTMEGMFEGCSALTSLDLSGFDFSNVTTMGFMFHNCVSLESIDVPTWNTSKVTSMSGMFCECRSLTYLDVSQWDTSSLTNMSTMFYNCQRLGTINGIGDIDTSNVTNLGIAFSGCSVATLDLSKWDVSNVEDFAGLFQACGNLTQLNISGWKTPSATSFGSAFNGCKRLTSLDLSEWDTSKATRMGYMFAGCDQLRNVTFGETFTFLESDENGEGCTLPEPKGTGKWVRASDKRTLTSGELQAASIDDPTSIAGEWSRLAMGFSFANSAETFGYPQARQRIPLEAYERVLTPAQARLAHAAAGWWWSGAWRGSCYGMSSAAAMLQKGDYVRVADFSDTAAEVADLGVKMSGDLGYTVQQYVESMQASLFDPRVQWALNYNGVSLADESAAPVEDLIDAVREASNEGGFVLVALWTREDRFKHGHAVLAYAVRDGETGRPAIDVYDPDDPGALHSIAVSDVGHAATWEYEVNGVQYSGGNNMSSDTVTGLAYVPYDVLSAPWKAHNASVSAPTTYSLVVGSDDFSVQAAGAQAAYVMGGSLQAGAAAGVYEYREVLGSGASALIAGQAEGDDAQSDAGDNLEPGEGAMLYLPIGSVYRVANDDASEPLTAALAEGERSASVSAGAGSAAKLDVSDADGRAGVSVSVPTGQQFEATVEVPGDSDDKVQKVTVAGTGDGVAVRLTDENGKLSHDVPDGTTLSVDGKAVEEISGDPRVGDSDEAAQQTKPAPTKASAPAKTKISKLKKAKKAFTATWKRSADADGYQVRYSLKKNMKKAKTKTVAGGAKTKLKVKKLKAKKRYYVQVRAYKVVDGKPYYSAWSGKKSVKVK